MKGKIMATKTEDILRLVHISDSIMEIQGYVGNANFNDFSSREDMRQAVAAQLGQIGGAAALLTDEFKEEHGEVDWEMLKALQYAGFDQELEIDASPLWFMVSENLQEINEQIQDLIVGLEDDEALDEVSLNEEDKRDIMNRFKDREAINDRNREKRDIILEDETPELGEEGIDNPEDNNIETDEEVRQGPFNP